MPHAGASLPPSHPLAAFRNEAGAFDLPSILTGVVAVGILTAGVLASVFGVIPFAQDRSAQQDLDSIRTAEGTAKATKGGYKAGPALVTDGLLPGQNKATAGTDTDRTCYAAVALSGSGKMFYNASSDPSPQPLTTSSTVPCISPDQLRAMINSIGGTAPAPGGGGTSTVLAFSAQAPDAVVTFMNADLAYNGSQALLDYAYPDGTWDALQASAAQTQWNAARNTLYNDPASATAFYDLTHRTDSGIPELVTARDNAENDFWNNPSADTQATYVSALYAMYKAELDAPAMSFASAASAATVSPVTQPAVATTDSAFQVRYANAEMAYKGSLSYLYSTYWWAAGDYTESANYRATLDASPVGQEWAAVHLTADGQPDLVSRTIMENITNRTDSGIPALAADVQAKETDFESNTALSQESVKQQAYVDALRLLYSTALANPPAYTNLQASAINDTFTVSASSTDVIHLQMDLPAGASVDVSTLQPQAYGDFASSTVDRPAPGSTTWSMNMDGPATQGVQPGVYHVVFKLLDPATGLSFYHAFTVNVQ